MEKNNPTNKRKRIPRAKSFFEREAWQNQLLVCGIDEVGRGCLAGPVVTAAVILERNKTFILLKDSKLLTKEQRIRAAKWIKQNSWYAYGIVSHQEIDQFNIYQATLRAMRRAVMHVIDKLPQLPAKIIVDAMPLTLGCESLKDVEIIHFPFAEQRSISVAAASILAKVKRDELMNVYDKIFPGYALAKHKGYATPSHRSLVKDLGHSIIHRETFLRKLDAEEEALCEHQIELFGRSD